MRIKKRRIIGFFALFALYSLVLLYFGMELRNNVPSITEISQSLYSKLKNYTTSYTATTEKLIIEIEPYYFDKIKNTRERALQNGRLISKESEYVRANIVYENRIYPAQIRLKGNLRDHWSHPNKWSYRVKLDGKETILGMRKFSLQHPKTRAYLSEWYFQKLLEYVGLINLRYYFIDFNLNGGKFRDLCLRGAYK